MQYNYSELEKIVIDLITDKVREFSPKPLKDKIQSDVALSFYGLDSLDIAEMFMIDFDRKFKITIDEEDIDYQKISYSNVTVNDIMNILCSKMSVKKTVDKSATTNEAKKISAIKRFFQTKFNINKSAQSEKQYQ